MCGNGVRVFAHYLRASGLETRDEFVVGSLAGPRPVVLHRVDATNADVTVDMGKANRLGRRRGGRRRPDVHRAGGRRRQPPPGLRRPGADGRGAGGAGCRRAGEFDPAQFPEGVNVEVLTAPADGAVSMRVHERGVGETRSCGTGTVAAAVAALATAARTPGP